MKYAPHKVERFGERIKVVEADEFTLARKVAKYVVRCPYRIPTQVGEEKILRRTG